MEKGLPADSNQKKSGISIRIGDKRDFKSESMTNGKASPFV